MSRTRLFVFGGLLIFSFLTGCFRKKAARNIEERLEELFPGQYQVVVSNLDMLDVVALYKGRKRAVIGDKSDADVQFLLDWRKGSDTLGVDAETVRQAHQEAAQDTRSARKLLAMLKEHGLEEISVGVHNQTAFIQVFAEPAVATREHVLRSIKAALESKTAPSPTNLSVELIEEQAYHAKYQDLITAIWFTGGWQQAYKTMSIEFDPHNGLDVRKLMRGWTINPASKRCTQYQEKAFAQAVEWSKRNLPASTYVNSDNVSYEIPEDNKLAIRYGFPYFAHKPESEVAEPVGYVCGRFDSEKGTFSQLRKQAEF